MASLDFKFAVGVRIKNWTIIEQISKSPYSEIYKVTHSSNFAILKLFIAKQDYFQVLHEFQLYQRVANEIDTSPKAYEISEEGDVLLWFAIQFIDAKNMSEFVKIHGPLKENEWFDFAKDLLLILEKIHRQNIIHRDIKPSNILFHKKKPVLIDYELSKFEDSLAIDNNIDIFGGTPEFSSPEHRSGENVPEMDIFSAASTLVFVGTGKYPFNGKNQRELIHAINKNDPKYYNLNSNQVNFLSYLFSKNKSDRISATEAIKIINVFKKTKKIKNRDLETNSISKNIEIEDVNIYDLANQIPDPNENLFQFNRRSKPRNKLIKLFNNLLFFSLAWYFFLYPQIFITQIIFPFSLKEQNIYNTNTQALDCLTRSFDLYSAQDYSNVREVKNECNNLKKLNSPLIYIAISQLNELEKNDGEQEKNLIKAASLDNFLGLKNLIAFYLKNDNFDRFGKKWLFNCSSNGESFCSKVLSFYFEKSGDSEKWIDYALKAIEQGDVFTATYIDAIFRKTEIGMRNLTFIEESANKGNSWAIEWLTVNTADEKWFNKAKELDLSIYYLLVAGDLIKNKNYDQALNLAQTCIKKYPLETFCYRTKYIAVLAKFGDTSLNLDEESKKLLENEVEETEKKLAIFGDISGRLEYAKTEYRKNNNSIAEVWFVKVAEYNDDLNSIYAYLNLVQINLSKSNIALACSYNSKASNLISISLGRSDFSETYLVTKLESTTNLEIPYDLKSNNDQFVRLQNTTKSFETENCYNA